MNKYRCLLADDLTLTSHLQMLFGNPHDFANITFSVAKMFKRTLKVLHLLLNRAEYKLLFSYPSMTFLGETQDMFSIMACVSEYINTCTSTNFSKCKYINR